MEEMMKSLMSDPQLMAELQAELASNPSLLSKLSMMQSDPQSAMQDPDLMSFMSKFAGRIGNDNLLSGMSSSSALSQTTTQTAVVTSTSTSQYRYKMSEAVKNGRPVIVDWTMIGCGPCEMLKPEFDRLSLKHPNILFLKVDQAQHRDVVNELGIRGFPTVKIYSSDGKEQQTITGLNVSALESGIEALVNASKKQLLNDVFAQFTHFPLKENEVVTFKQVAWDKVQEKIKSTLSSDNTIDTKLYAPFAADSHFVTLNYSTPSELLTTSIEIINFLSNFNTTSMKDIPNTFLQAIFVMAEGWLQSEHYSAILHIIRLAALHNDFSKQLAQHPFNIISKLTSVLQEAPDTIAAILGLRCLCNFFIKKSFVRSLMNNANDIKSVIAYTVITYNDDKNVMTGALALLLNMTYTLFCYTPTDASQIYGDLEKNIMVKIGMDYLEFILETLPLFVTTQPQPIYSAVVGIGTLLFPFYLMLHKSKANNQEALAKKHIAVIKNFLTSHVDMMNQLQTWRNDVENGDKKTIGAIDDLSRLFRTF